MKGLLDRTKVVLRHMPPTIPMSTLMERVDDRFAGRYNWFSFRQGKSSMNSYSRAYIDFKRPDDVIEFAEFFNGHVFVNEKGAQYKTVVEYAPSQRIPRQWSKKDGREGTISKDPDHLKFLEYIAKPVENLPSAEIQLERKEAERAGAAKDAPIVTPLMDFVRQKRAAKSVSRRSLGNGKLTRRGSGASSTSPSSSAVKQGPEKRRTSSAMYILRDAAKSTSGKEKSTYVQVPKSKDHQPSEKPVTSVVLFDSEAREEESGASGMPDIGKKKYLLLKGKEKEIPLVSGGLSQQSAGKNAHGTSTFRQNQRREAPGRIIRSILDKSSRRNQASSLQSDQQNQISEQDRDKRPPRPLNLSVYSKDLNGIPENKAFGNDSHGFYSEKHDRRVRNKERPDRGVWTLKRSDGSHASDESLSSSTSQSMNLLLDSIEGSQGEAKLDMPTARIGEFKFMASGRSHFSVDNGSHKISNRRGPPHGGGKDVEGSNVSEVKPLKRGSSSGYGSHEKQVWVQKSSSGS